MKKFATFAIMAAMANYASATLYTDPSGDTFPGIAHIDIVSVEVLNDLSDITFTINVNGNLPDAPNTWGNFMIGIDSVNAAGDTGNAWARPISFTSNPIDFWVGGWTDGGGGAQLWSYNGATWDAATAPGYTFGGSQIQFVIPLANLGLSPTDTFNFDVFTSGTGGTDGAIDSLTNPSQTIADWGNAYEVTSTSEYTVVPEPATLSLLAIAGATLAVVRRRRV